MRVVAPVTEVLDAIYRPEPEPEAWLEGIRLAGAQTFGDHLSAQAYVLRWDRDGGDVEMVSADEPYRTALVESVRLGDQAAVDILQRWSPIVFGHIFPADHPCLAPGKRLGLGDVCGAAGFPDAGRAAFLSFALPRRTPRIDARTRQALRQISAHLGAGLRLRSTCAASPDEAVLTPSGEVVHAEVVAGTNVAREQLRAAARGIVKARSECARDPASGLEFWRAMVAGRWTLVDRCDSDGKRLLIAKRNVPSSVLNAALSEREQVVVERAALGASVRYVAYELGLPESTASEALARALKKLGLRSRAELVELRASLVPRDA